MEDYIQRQIDMIGQMLLLLAKKLRLVEGGRELIPVDEIQTEIEKDCFDLDIKKILSEKNPVSYMVEVLGFSDVALETFTDIVMHSDADATTQQQILEDAVSYLDSKGYFSFSLHSYLV